MVTLSIAENWVYLDLETAKILNDELSFAKMQFRGRGIKPERTIVRMIVFEKHTNRYKFPLGMPPRAYKFLTSVGTQCQIFGESGHLEVYEPFLSGITFSPHQIYLMDRFLTSGRGTIVSPTGSGKSIIIAGIISAATGKVLVLVQSVDLVRDLYDMLVGFGFKVGLVQGKHKNLGYPVTVATIQTISKLPIPEDLQMVLVDEGHHIAKLNSLYAKFLMRVNAPLKGAFTATPYTKDTEQSMVLEACVGPVIGEYELRDAEHDKVIAKPLITMRKLPELPIEILLANYAENHQEDEPGLTDFRYLYSVGIVYNPMRNATIVDDAKEFVSKGLTVLINVIRVEHGEMLLKAFQEHSELRSAYAHGGTSDRRKLLKALENKELDVLIATTVFNEGVNIPSLGAVINAAGYKTKVGSVQKLGRGLRRAAGKEVLHFRDYVDTCHRILRAHSVARRKTYQEIGWDVTII